MAAHSSTPPRWCSNLIAAARVRSGEVVIVRVDEALTLEGKELVRAVEGSGASASLSVAPPVPEEHAPPELLDAVRAADVMITMWRRPRRQTAAGREVLANLLGHGGRVIAMPLMTRELLHGVLSEPPADVAETAHALVRELEGAAVLRVRGRAGTDVEFDVGGRVWATDGVPLEPGTLANYPSGEVFVLPHNGNGDLLVDLTIPYAAETLLDEPVSIRLDDGRIAAIDGGAAAEALRRLVAEAGEGGDRVVELGIGINPALRPIGHALVDEKVAGTAHVGFGNSAHMGGDNVASIHFDCVFSGAEVWADGRRVELP